VAASVEEVDTAVGVKLCDRPCRRTLKDVK